MRFKLGLCALAAIALATPLSGKSHAAIQTVLSLAIDVSGSVNTTEYNLQMDGYAAAFNSSAVQNYLDAATDDIAVQVVFFGTNAAIGTPYTILSDSASAAAFANTLANLVRPFQGNTNIADGIFEARLAMANFITAVNNDLNPNNNVLPDARRIIDVSGDGIQNVGVNPIPMLTAERDAAHASGIVINGLAITSDLASLPTYYNTNVRTPTGFVITANGFEAFGDAVRDKIIREITGNPEVPEPASMICWASLGVIGLVATRIRRKRVS
jgi:hypothetical protein